ncbi:hypothetical protein [Butyrivibrio sp. XBB1001]|uniref:hypothetical protein n=1 Tax=Butyrivibrio sp. XBB1001 TaxID=1280682 RepID=UPI00042213A4|nr:hypothetical protein [Butyrivibrio sp. XBB1001]
MRKSIVPVVLCAVAILTACGGSKTEEPASIFETVETEKAQQEADETKDPGQVADETPAQQTENSGEGVEQITNEQAFNAVMNYCKSVNPDFSAEINTEGYTEYWDTTTDESGEILVIYRSYTGAQTRYHINPSTGEAYVTELVPGIIDEEQPTGETFNARDFLE